jgi:hemoglobin
MPEASLYERLGGVFAIAAVIDHFSDAVVQNPIVGQRSENPALREWHTNDLGRLPEVHAHALGLQRCRWTLRVPRYAARATALGLEEAHRQLKISPAEFDEVAAELGRTLDFVKVPQQEKEEVLAAFAAHKDEVTEGYAAAATAGR